MIDDKIEHAVMRVIAEKANISINKLKLSDSLTNDLGMDSFTLVEIAHEIKGLYGIRLTLAELSKVRTVGDTIIVVKNTTAQGKVAA